MELNVGIHHKYFSSSVQVFSFQISHVFNFKLLHLKVEGRPIQIVLVSVLMKCVYIVSLCMLLLDVICRNNIFVITVSNCK